MAIFEHTAVAKSTSKPSTPPAAVLYEKGGKSASTQYRSGSAAALPTHRATEAATNGPASNV
jgi:hypothetical protein